MKKVFKYIFMILLFFTVNHKVNFAQELQIKFYSSFLYPGTIKIYFNKDTCEIELNIYNISDSLLWKECNSFACYELDNLNIMNWDKLSKNLDFVIIDGLTILGKYSDSQIIKEFKIQYFSDDKYHFELFNNVLLLLKKHMKTKISKRYIRRLKVYLK